MPHLLLTALAFFLVGCGNGGGRGDDPPSTPQTPPGADPFGLTSRPSFGGANLPTDSSQPGGVVLVDAFPNLDFSAPIFLAGVPGENRLAIVEQGGRVRAFVQDAQTAVSTIVLDLSGVVLFSGEQGLLGFAFDPGFAQNRYIYVHYSRDNPRRSVIARYRWDAVTDLADLDTEKIILELAQPFSNHNGGMLAFGPGDYLYVAFGDGGSGGDPLGNGQNGLTLLGTVLRLDVHPADDADPYAIPLDNPFVGDAAVRDEIYAMGLRNPFRFSFDRQTGDLWLGDVGQGEIEEIDLVTAGGNYGWCVYEGTQLFNAGCSTLPDSAFTFPVWEYDHSQGFAVIGGYVYRGTSIPSLFGTYVYTDFVSGTIWSLVYDGANVTSNTVIGAAPSPTSFGEDHVGELYVVSQGGDILALQETGAGEGVVPIPALLSETGIFTDLGTLQPVSGFVEYGVNVPFWSDGAVKRRWIAIPDGQTMTFAATGAWDFPVGTVLVKHFDMEMVEQDASSLRRLETRVLVRRLLGWVGFTYRWNAGETDADLVTARETEDLTVMLSGGEETFTYTYPSSADCAACHTTAAGGALSARTRQVNRDFDFPDATDNQLRTFDHIGFFAADAGISNPALFGAFVVPATARAYLDVNCAQCHRPGGPAPVDLDLRFDSADASMNAIGVAPLAGDLGIADARIVTAGEKETSVLWQRMRTLSNERMPPLSSHRVDQAGVDLVGAWIDAM
ncbi:MAG: PQQ-dependent sugar dehydrogenase [Gammaproteobacteria bacterium]|nr:PQQ-dependent sugar dehydrogenase [Gammaproteobacteria bacterium]